jgi:hypothetical protein
MSARALSGGGGRPPLFFFGLALVVVAGWAMLRAWRPITFRWPYER